MEIHQKVLKYIRHYNTAPEKVNRLVVSSFLVINRITFKNNIFLSSLIIKNEDIEYTELSKFLELTNSVKFEFSFEELIKIFEFVISPIEKEVNGAVYTPNIIRHHIINSVVEHNLSQDSLIGDISCGCGGFLFDMALVLKKKFNLPYKQIFEKNLFGIDIADYSIERTKILLTLLAISQNEDESKFDFNLFTGNSLNYDWFNVDAIRNNSGFDFIIGNPPYVGASKIDQISKELLKEWTVTSEGKADLYIPFFEIGMNWLCTNGLLGYITVSSFYRSVNGRGLRTFFKSNKYDFKLIDFGDEQIFRGRTTYTCICLITKSVGSLKYVKCHSSNLKQLNDKKFVKIEYIELSNKAPWILNTRRNKQIISKIETCGSKLGDRYSLKNGFATLKNSVYLFSPIDQDAHNFIFEKDNVIYEVEKKICVDAIKPNILKLEQDVIDFNEKLIFPYITDYVPSTKSGKKIKVTKLLPEEIFKEKFPLAYTYLNTCKEALRKRDKENRKYENWYAYGRNQALNLRGKKLLFPYISDKPYFVYTKKEDLYFYNGYAIVSDSENELKVLQKILKSKIFWFYVVHTSKPYSNGYYSLAINYIKNFGIPYLTVDEKNELLSEEDPTVIDLILSKKYGVSV